LILQEATMLTEKTFATGNMTLHYVEGPAGGRPLLMLHGITLRWQNFLSVLPLFSCRYHTYALDLRGHGHSSRATGAYRIEEYAEDVIQFLRAQVTAPAVLLGFSLGAEIAIQVAATAPELTRAIVLEEPGLYLFPEGRFPQHSLYQLFTTLYSLLSRTPSMAEIIAVLQTLLPEGDEVGFRDWATSLRQLDPDALATDHGTRLAHPREPRIRECAGRSRGGASTSLVEPL
jgi:pimeloyl-ACP methyl ester carboxylesterase